MKKTLLLSTLALFVLLAPLASALPAEARVRLMAANITSGEMQSYEDPGIRIFKALEPDIVLIQEFRYRDDTPSDIRQLVDLAFGEEFHYYREDGRGLPNGVVSRYPILAAGEWEDSRISNRDFAWARIDVPGPIDLWAVSVHLKAGRDNPSRTKRFAQMQELAELIRQHVPEGDYLALGGDFNTQHVGEPGFSFLAELLVHAAPFPADTEGNTSTNSRRSKPYDWVLADLDLHALEVPVLIGSRSFPSGLVFDSRQYTPLAEVAPVQRGDSAVAGMQHMAVVRDFLLP